MARTDPRRGRLLRAEVLWDDVDDPAAFPYSLSAVRCIDSLALEGSVTFLVGENGTGESTVLEAIAAAAGLNPEGGSRNLRFSYAATESNLSERLRLVWRGRHSSAFFLRAETFFNTATAYEQVEIGGYHQRSHGEQFIDVTLGQFQPGGLYLMDEPESALSIHGELRLPRRMYDLASDSQFIVATHSPVLLAYPDAVIYSFDDTGVNRVRYDETDACRLTKSFLDAPQRFLRHLFADD